MRLLFVIDSLGLGGAQRQMVNLAVGLTADSHQVDLFLYYPDYEHFAGLLQHSGVRIHRLKKQGRYDWRPILGLRKLILSDEYDAALAFLATPAFYLEMSAVGSQLPIVVSERYMYSQQTLGMGERVLQHIHRLADAITVNSHHQYQRMLQMFPWMQPKLTLIPNGVDLAEFYPVRERPGRGPQRRRFHFLVLSSIVPKKNPVGLVRGLAEFHRVHPEYGGRIKVQWAGAVARSVAGQEEFGIAEALIGESGLRESWEWLGERRNVAELLRNADALIHPALCEGLPNAICEALASGLPVLAGDIGDHPHLIEHGRNGFLFPPTEPKAIADAIYRFCVLTETERNRMSLMSRLYAEENLSMEGFVRAYESLFREIC